ncbi:MAG TPA: type II secretion system F family protein [Nocardioidaceae bacterium]|nr:type II secretion system F family protein [Nocardioidaceae bacterium]
MRPSTTWRRLLGRIAVSGVALATVGVAAPAYAAEGSIDHVQDSRGVLQILYSIPAGVTPDLSSLVVTFQGTTLPSEAELASEASEEIRRTTVLAMDVSDSMSTDGRIDAAKEAAATFLENAPEDLNVGLVTFAGNVTTVSAPTTDHDELAATIQGLELSRGTRLYQGVQAAVAATGREGARSVLVLSDGADSTSTPISTALSAITSSGASNRVKVDVVAISQGEEDRDKLAQIAAAGGGAVLDADDPSQIEGLFEDEASALAAQVLISATPPANLRGQEGQIDVALTAGGEAYTDAAFVTLSEEAAPPPEPEPLQATDTGLIIPKSAMWLGLGFAAVAVMFLVFAAGGGFGRRQPDVIEASIEAYTRQGARKLAAAQQSEGQSVTQQAVGAAASFLEQNKGIEATLGSRLEAAGLQLKPAEWLLAHVGIAIGAGFFGLLLGGGSLLWMLIGLVLGAALPWVYLGVKKSRRTKAFKRQLADTLQLMAGSLSAGLSLAQAVDTVVREGLDPVANEFRRAIVEARLGVDIEDALAGIADRMQSKDFEWVVMAIRIQREVGGNLAELLNKVAETIREREYLERQVLTLSAEGRLSVWVLGGLPPGFIAYLSVANPTYLSPLIHERIGWVLLVVMGMLELVGVFWMKKLVKVDV